MNRVQLKTFVTVAEEFDFLRPADSTDTHPHVQADLEGGNLCISRQ